MSTNNLIGRVLATEKNPTTIDDFTFWTAPDLILNPFDIVKVQHVNNSYSYGVIEDIAHITDAASFLTNFISSDFGDVSAEENTLRVGMNYVTAKVICNTENIYIPLQSNMFTDAESRKQQKAIKTLLSKMGIVDTLNLYIHFPDMVDISLILHTWNTMKLFVIKCLKI